MNKDIAERVARGAAWLDEHEPGWERRINLGTLDLGDGFPRVPGQGCIVCQVTGLTFPRGTRQLGVPCFEEWKFGLVSRVHGTRAALDREYAALDEAWRSLIKERFESGLLSDESGLLSDQGVPT